MKTFIRAFRAEDDSETGPLTFIASTDQLARDGLIIDADAWELDNYRANPVFLWVHDYSGRTLPLGRAEVEMVDGALKARVTFDQDDEFAVQVERKYRAGYLHAVSVGWDTHEILHSSDGQTPPRVMRAVLLDISGVPVPGDPGALIERQALAMRSLLTDVDERAGGALTSRDLSDLEQASELINGVRSRAKQEPSAAVDERNDSDDQIRTVLTTVFDKLGVLSTTAPSLPERN